MQTLIESLTQILETSALLLGDDISEKYHADWSGASPCVPAAPWGATRKGLDDAVSQHRGADLSSVPSSRAPCAKCALGGILWRVESAACREQSGFELVRVAGCVTMGARSWQTT